MSFKDIIIVGLDVDKTQPSDKASGLRHMFLRLSERPGNDWVKIFEGERSFARQSMWRDAWIEGNYIVVDCVPEEIEKYHLKDLKEDVSNSNTKYKEYLTQVQVEEGRRVERDMEERDRLNKIKGDLDFDE